VLRCAAGRAESQHRNLARADVASFELRLPATFATVSADEIDAYLAELEEPKRRTLEELRRMIREVLPEGEEGLSYGVPAFKVGGKPVVGFAAAAKHLSYFPHSGQVITDLASDLVGYSTSKGGFRFNIGEVPPKELVEKLIAARLAELETN